MAVPTSTKARLLELHSSGKYATVGPDKLFEFYKLTHEFLSLNTSPSSSLTEFEYYEIVELNFYLSLQTNHDIEAQAMLQQLGDKFDFAKSERLIILRSIYVEATQGPTKALEYIRESVPLMNISAHKDSLMGLKKRELILDGKLVDKKIYVENLLDFIETQPLDVSCWFELSRIYYEMGEFDKCIYALQEILLIKPFAYNVMAKIGETYYLNFIKVSKNSTPSERTTRQLNEYKENGIKYFSRSLELCSNYARSWVGLYKFTSSSLDQFTKKSDSSTITKNAKLNKLALQNLEMIKAQDLISDENKAFVETII